MTVEPLAVHITSPFRVRYKDTDRMGHVYYSQYLVWFEIGRTEFLRQLGSTYRSWEDEMGIFLPVRDCHIKYRKPALYDDLITVETKMMRLSRASVDFDYIVRIADEEGSVLAEGSTSHAFIDGSGKICRIADQLLPQFFRL